MESSISNELTRRIEQYISQHESENCICSINDILKIISETVINILPIGRNASVELHHFDPYTTIIITVPGDSVIAKQGPYTYKVRTSE